MSSVDADERFTIHTNEHGPKDSLLCVIDADGRVVFEVLYDRTVLVADDIEHAAESFWRAVRAVVAFDEEATR